LQLHSRLADPREENLFERADPEPLKTSRLKDISAASSKPLDPKMSGSFVSNYLQPSHGGPSGGIIEFPW